MPSGRVQITSTLPVRQRESFLRPLEIAMFRSLRETAAARRVLPAKVGLDEFFHVASPNENVHCFNRLFRKSIDFLFRSPETLRPQVGMQGFALDLMDFFEGQISSCRISFERPAAPGGRAVIREVGDLRPGAAKRGSLFADLTGRTLPDSDNPC